MTCLWDPLPQAALVGNTMVLCVMHTCWASHFCNISLTLSVIETKCILDPKERKITGTSNNKNGYSTEGKSHENCYAFDGVVGKPKIFYTFFSFFFFLNIVVFMSNFRLKFVPRWCPASIKIIRREYKKNAQMWYLVYALICTGKICLSNSAKYRVFCTKMTRIFQQCTNYCEIGLPSIP
jgi:hypothetical protein